MTTPTILNFREEKLHERPPIRKIRENSLPRKFPAIYMVYRYYVHVYKLVILVDRTEVFPCIITGIYNNNYDIILSTLREVHHAMKSSSHKSGQQAVSIWIII